MTLSVAGSCFHDPWRDPSGGNTLTGVEAAVRYRVLNSFSVGVQIHLLAAVQPSQTPFLGGFSIPIRWTFLRPGRWTFYLEGSLGVLGATAPVPAPNGTTFNFFQRIGNGCTIRVTDHLLVFATVGYMHLSNANIQGPERNPTLNALGGQLGLVFGLPSVPGLQNRCSAPNSGSGG